MPKTITLAMIVKDEERHLPRLLDSVRQHVDELIIVDTGSTDQTKAVALRYGARVLDFTAETHPQAFIMDDETTEAPGPYSRKMMLADFGAARQHSLDAATGDYVLWLDADDVLVGGEHLRPTVEMMERDAVDVTWMVYNYGHDDGRRVACELKRERLVRRGKMRWINPIHEVMVPVEGVTQLRSLKSPVMWVDHHRPPERSAVVAFRNYKVLKRAQRQQPNDARTLFYLANEARIVNPDEAIACYERYVEISGWPEERCMARIYLGELYEMRNQVGRAYASFSAATVDDERMPEGWFALARIAYRMQHFDECVRWTERGLKLGVPETIIMINPLARSVSPHFYYHIALNAVGRVQEAYDSCAAGLAVIPDQPLLRRNIETFRAFLDGLAADGDPRPRSPLSPVAREGIRLALGPLDTTTPPAAASATILEAAALRLWKACIEGGEPFIAEELLRALPIAIRESPLIDAMRARGDAIYRDTEARRAALPELPDRAQSVIVADAIAQVQPYRVPQEAWDKPMTLYRQSPREIRAELEGLSRRVVDAYVDGDKLVAHSDSGKRPSGPEVVIWTGPAVEPWTPLSPSRGGIGGSETACIEMARGLASRGFRVTVYSDCREGEGVYGLVEYRHYGRVGAGIKCDVFISSRQPHIAEVPIDAKLKLLWVHDVHCGAPDPNLHRWLLRFDYALCLTEWHRQLVMKTYPWMHESRVLVTRNGIDPARYAGDTEIAMYGDPDARQASDDPMDLAIVNRLPAKLNRAFYSSSPNRGLDALLDLWPQVRERVADAELHVFYGFDSWEATAKLQNNAAELAEIERYKKRLAETAGVVWRGRVSQAELAREQLLCKVWAYPTWFSETYCITAVEAQAAGAVPVCSDIAALTETAKWGMRIPGSPSEPAYRAAWVDAVVTLMQDDERRAAIAAAARKWALTISWASLADEWAAMFDELVGEADAQPVHPYVSMPTIEEKAA